MKALVVALLLVAIVVVALPSTARASSPCTPSQCRISVARTIATNSWGATVITDKVSLNDTVPVTNVTIGIPTSVGSNLIGSQANDTSGTNLRIVTSSTLNQTYKALTVQFQSAVKQYKFNLTTIYWGLLTYSSTGSSYTFSVNPFPLIDNSYNASATSSFSYTGGWTSPKIAPPVNQTLSTSAYSAPYLKPFNNTVWTVSFSSASSQNLFSLSAGRTITISPSNSVLVTDNYNLTNLGPTTSSIPFTLPKGVSGISESYVLGVQIDQPSTTPTPTTNPDGTTTVTFTPSFGSLPFGQSVKVKISYTLASSSYLTSGSLGRFTLNFALFSNVQFYEPSLQTKIVTPMGFRLTSVSGQVPLSSSSGQIVFQTSPVSPTSNLSFSMTYQLDPFWSTLSPLGWAALVELAIAASVVAVWKGVGPAGAVGVPTQLISRFADLYDEKSSMRMESDKMEDDVTRGALNRFDYRQRRRSLDRRMGEIDRELGAARGELAAVSSRYADMTKRLERAEAELGVIANTSADLKNQYRGGKLSKDLYESLNTDLVRRRQRAEQTIDSVIINLREETR